MRRITHKLKSRCGASLIIALLLFFVASMVSMLILTASLTAAKRMRDDRDREQEYLALSSAARTVKKSLESSSVTFTEEEVYKDGVLFSRTLPDYPSPAGPLGGTLKTCVKALNDSLAYTGTLAQALREGSYSGEPSPQPIAVTVTVSSDDSEVAGAFPNATFTTANPASVMQLKKDASGGTIRYPITAAIVLDGGDQRIYLNANAVIEPASSYYSTTTDTEYGGKDSENNDIWITVTTYTYTTTIKWSNVELSTVPPKG